jgi:predicted nucleic acid-binding protein
VPYLLDTNVLTELRKGRRGDQRVRAWAETVSGERHFVSVLSLGEIRKGIERLRRKSPQQCEAFEQWLEQLSVNYAEDILEVNDAVADRWGRLEAGQTRPVIDGLLATTAWEFGLTIATRNTKDFAGTGVKLVNPFDWSAAKAP